MSILRAVMLVVLLPVSILAGSDACGVPTMMASAMKFVEARERMHAG